MANSPSPDSVTLSLRVKRTLHKRLCIIAEQRKEKLSDAVRHLLEEIAHHVTLTPADYAQIAKDTEAAIIRKNRGDKPSQAQLEARNSSGSEKTVEGEKNEH